MYVGDVYINHHNTAMVVVNFLFTVAALLLVLLRSGTRLWLVRSFGWDDAFIILATFGTIGFTVSTIFQAKFGLGLPPDPTKLTKFIEASTASVLSYTISTSCVKISISFQCYRIFCSSPRPKRIFTGFIAFFCVLGLLTLFLTVFTCNPPAKYWNSSIEGTCLDNRALRYAFAGINIFCDIVILIAPMPLLRSLHLQRRARYVLIGVFAAGAVACIVSIVRLYTLWQYSSVPVAERPVKGVLIAIWGSLECNIAIICASIPALRPFFTRTFPALFGSTKGGPSNAYTNESSRWHRRFYGNLSRANDNATDRAGHQSGHRSATQSSIEEGKGIHVDQSFEMKTTVNTTERSVDNDSEENLVDDQPSQWIPVDSSGMTRGSVTVKSPKLTPHVHAR